MSFVTYSIPRYVFRGDGSSPSGVVYLGTVGMFRPSIGELKEWCIQIGVETKGRVTILFPDGDEEFVCDIDPSELRVDDTAE